MRLFLPMWGRGGTLSERPRASSRDRPCPHLGTCMWVTLYGSTDKDLGWLWKTALPTQVQDQTRNTTSVDEAFVSRMSSLFLFTGVLSLDHPWEPRGLRGTGACKEGSPGWTDARIGGRFPVYIPLSLWRTERLLEIALDHIKKGRLPLPSSPLSRTPFLHSWEARVSGEVGPGGRFRYPDYLLGCSP